MHERDVGEEGVSVGSRRLPPFHKLEQKRAENRRADADDVDVAYHQQHLRHDHLHGVRGGDVGGGLLPGEGSPQENDGDGSGDDDNDEGDERDGDGEEVVVDDVDGQPVLYVELAEDRHVHGGVGVRVHDCCAHVKLGVEGQGPCHDEDVDENDEDDHHLGLQQLLGSEGAHHAQAPGE